MEKEWLICSKKLTTKEQCCKFLENEHDIMKLIIYDTQRKQKKMHKEKKSTYYIEGLSKIILMEYKVYRHFLFQFANLF